MIRIEYKPQRQFEDRATFSVINRELPVPKFSKTDDGEFLTITTDALSLRYRKGSNPMTNPASPENLTVVLPVNGKPVTWYPGLKDPLNLKGTYRTLDGNNGDSHRRMLEDGTISRSGWAVIKRLSIGHTSRRKPLTGPDSRTRRNRLGGNTCRQRRPRPLLPRLWP